MLDVGPRILTVPMVLSLTVSTADTLFELASKAATMLRVGDIAIRPGEPPLPRGLTRAIVSFVPLIKYRAPKLLPLEIPWDARTRSVRPLGCALVPLPPHELKLTQAQSPNARARIRLVKRLAPKNMKKGDLSAKSWIITDRQCRPAGAPIVFSNLLTRRRCAEWHSSCILSNHGERFSLTY